MNAPPKDSRRHRRFAVDVEAVVHGPSGTVSARTRDVSRSGICLITSTPFSGSQLVVVELVLAFGNNAFSEPLHVDARVVWCTPIGQAFQVGAMFSELSDENREFLDMFLRYLDGSLAPTGQENGSESEADEEGEDTPPPDVKDDPFRH
jgi:hypothetical protein